MTIAACYVSAEGVVFGADSTSTLYVESPDPITDGADHHYNFAQKIFQVGEHGTLGITLWGLGSLPGLSYRTLIAQFADTLQSQPYHSMEGIARSWARHYWSIYTDLLSEPIQQIRDLSDQGVENLNAEELGLLAQLRQTFVAGFCIGGYCLPDRTPQAYEIVVDPIEDGPPDPNQLEIGTSRFWGCPNIMHRMIYGVDFEFLESIMQSDQWTGTTEDLIQLLSPHRLAQPFDLPIRDAIDWVYTSIYTTSQTMKFSHLAPVCGGPVEVAVITTDRPFRWVKHKSLDAAISQGG